MFKAGFDLFRRIDPYFSLGGHIGTALSIFGITWAVVLSAAVVNLSWFWDVFHWAGAIFVGLIGWLISGVAVRFFTANKTSKTELKLDYWLAGIVFSAIGLVVCMVGYALSQSGQTNAHRDNLFKKNVTGPPIEWRFDKPVTLFWYVRKPGEAVWIEAIVINATNKSDLALKKVSGTITADMKSDMLSLNVNSIGDKIENSATIIPAREDFTLSLIVGLSAEQFLKQFGKLRLSFSYEQDGNRSNQIEEFSLSYLEDQIAYIKELTRTGFSSPKKSEVDSKHKIQTAALRIIDDRESTKVVYKRGVKSVDIEFDRIIDTLAVRCSFEATNEVTGVDLSAFVGGELVPTPYVIRENTGDYVALDIVFADKRPLILAKHEKLVREVPSTELRIDFLSGDRS